MTLPSAATVVEVIAATWPPAEVQQVGPVIVRRGEGGGSRVSSATIEGQVTDAEIDAAAKQMDAWGQPSLFMIRDGDEELDQKLDRMGYEALDHSVLYAAPATKLLNEPIPPVTVFEAWPPLAAQRDVWADGGIGAGRLAVMDRCEVTKTSMLGRADDRPAATGFLALDDDISMLHALEVLSSMRRKGLARAMTRAAARWTVAHGGSILSLITTEKNTAANALYSSLGMTRVGRYHYRKKSE